MEEVRQNTSRYERLGIKEITDHYDGIIRGLGAPPVIMGHSFGGLITQLLLNRGLGASAVDQPGADKRRVHPAPRPGQGCVGGAEEPGQPPQDSDAHARGVPLRLYQHAHTRGVEADLRQARVLGPGRTLFQAAFANFTPHAVTTVNRDNSSRAPLLFLANGKDHTVPAGRRAPPARSRRRRARSPSSRNTPTAPTPPSPRTAGKRWRTTRSTGPCATRGPNPPQGRQA